MAHNPTVEMPMSQQEMDPLTAGKDEPSAVTATNQVTTVAPEAVSPILPEVASSPPGTMPGAAPGSGTAVSKDAVGGVGIEGEEVVWEARYSLKNFAGRLTLTGFLILGWVILAIYTWGFQAGTGLKVVSTVLGIALLVGVINLMYRLMCARFGHFYRLTTRRLFVGTGVFARRSDMMELLKVQDVFIRQTMTQRWLSVGTVVVESSDSKLPRLFLPGVDDPQGVLDTIWHYARAERDLRSMKVESV
jgi:membrane protein YdbS with pleckstrin-like domain